MSSDSEISLEDNWELTKINLNSCNGKIIAIIYFKQRKTRPIDMKNGSC